MTLPFLAPMMLLGLIGLAIPIIIHLLNRRRFNVVDWGAMQFLQISEATRRRIMVEELLLMLLRMGLIALFVMALALPFVPNKTLASMVGGGDRDVVIIFDGSYSMGFKDQGKSAHDSAKEWATAFVNDLGSAIRWPCSRRSSRSCRSSACRPATWSWPRCDRRPAGPGGRLRLAGRGQGGRKNPRR